MLHIFIVNSRDVQYFFMISFTKKRILTVVATVCIYMLIPGIITLAVTGIVGMDVSDMSITGRRVVIKHNNATQEFEVNRYIAMVIASRYDVVSEPQALMALSIAVRTDIYRAMGTGYTVDSESLNMEYMSERQMKKAWGNEYDRIYKSITDAVSATKGMVLTCDGELIEARFHSVSAGKTLSGEKYLGEGYGYLSETECTGDIQSRDYLRVVQFTNKEFVKKLKSHYPDIGLSETNPLMSVQIVSKADSGYVLKLQVGNVIISGMTMANIFGLNSNCMTIERCEDGIKITTKGVGDGYGMSLYYANYLAKNAETYQQILGKFYSNTTLSAY